MSGDTGPVAAATQPDSTNLHKYDLEKGTELRFEVDADPVVVRMVSGKGELFGTELRIEQKYTFKKGDKVAIFTFHGCKLKLFGKPEVQYVAMETPMTFYINLSNALEGLRVQAETQAQSGPNVLVCGPSDVGKSTLCRILLNYAVRSGRTPIFVDLDLGQGAVSVPGSIGGVVIEKPADVEGTFQMTAPIVYHYGHSTQSINPTLYDLIMGALAEAIERKKQVDNSVKYSGIIVNTSGWVQGYGYQSLLQAIKHFNIDTVLVIDQERLFSELSRDLKNNNNTKVIFTPKSGGVVSRTREFRAESRDERIRSYFYGNITKPLYPYSFDVPFSQFVVYKIGSPNLPDSCLPIGMRAEDNSTKLLPISPSIELRNHLLAISCATNNTTEELSKAIVSNVFGFVAVTNVDMERQVVTVLSPQPRPLPKNSVLLFSDIQFVDLE
ncbi:hypothetical protein RDWZM_004037 [Blomia tropicalis]|uniref:Protein CLP1 homolog n=1 Tax=Blomia tropicalis TaxID=40697 RepID=A0A9Q0MJG5_BLOTA|nr:hypothetical protein RDWZM_004037 [Blomia tropicalis]